MKKFLLTRNYILTVLSATFFYTTTLMINSVCASYVTSMGNTKTVAGIIACAFTFSSFFARPICGYISDKKSRKKVYVIGALFSILSAIIIIFLPKMMLLFISRVFFGIGYSAVTTSGGTVICDIAGEENISSAIAVYGISNAFSQVIAPGFALWLLEFGFNFVGWASLILLLLSLVLFLFVKYDEKKFVSEKIKFQVFERKALPASYVILFFAIATASVYSFIPVFAEEKNIGKAGYFYAVSASFLLVARLLNSKIKNKFGASNIFTFGAILFLFGFCSLAFTSNLWIFLVAAILYGIGSGVIHPVVNAAAVRGSVNQNRAIATSTFMMSQDLGMAIGAIIWGFLSEKAGFLVMYLCSAFIVIIMIFIFKKFLYKSLK